MTSVSHRQTSGPRSDRPSLAGNSAPSFPVRDVPVRSSRKGRRAIRRPFCCAHPPPSCGRALIHGPHDHARPHAPRPRSRCRPARPRAPHGGAGGAGGRAVPRRDPALSVDGTELGGHPVPPPTPARRRNTGETWMPYWDRIACRWSRTGTHVSPRDRVRPGGAIPDGLCVCMRSYRARKLRRMPTRPSCFR